MAFKFYLDGFLTDQPNNDTELITTIKRDSDLSGFLTTQDVTLVYSANNDLASGEISGYAYLKAAFDSGTCNEVDVTIYDEISSTETYRVYTGVMKVPAMTIMEGVVTLSTKIEDNSFYAYIKNNKNIKFSLYATKSKNGEAITPCQIYEVDMFNSAAGVYGSTIGYLYRGYRVYDVLRFLVPALSDNKVTFESDFLTSMSGAPATPSDPIELFIFDGQALVKANYSPNVMVSFEEITRELFKLKNLSFYIDQTDPDAPVLRLESADWFYVQSNILTFDEPKEIKTSIKPSKLYGTIKVGSDYNPGGSAPQYTWNAGTSYFGWKEETYSPYGQCNTDSELDLLNSYIIASNAINDQLVGVLTSNLDRNFIVECDNVDTTLFTASAVAYDTYATPPEKFYNMGLNNVTKVALHGGNFQAALSNTENAGSDICHISYGTNTVIANFNTGSQPYTVNPVPFADEFGGVNYDGGNNWSLADFNYDSPLAGNYSFSTVLNVEVLNCATGVGKVLNTNFYPGYITVDMIWGVEITTTIAAYTDITYATLITSAQTVFYTYTNGQYPINVALPVLLPLNAKVKVTTSITTKLFAPGPTAQNSSGQTILLPYFGGAPIPNTWLIQIITNPYNSTQPNRIVYLEADSYFECNGTPDGALVLASPDPEAYKVKLHEFEYDISAEDFRTIQALPIGSFEFIKDGVTRSGFIEEMKHSNWTGRTQIKLISNALT